MTSTRRSRLRIAGIAVAVVLIVGALITLAILWITLGDRGIYADATHTSGYTDPSEVVAGVLAFIALTVGVGLGVSSIVARPRRR